MYRYGAHMGKSEPRAGSDWQGQESGPRNYMPYSGPSLNDIFSGAPRLENMNEYDKRALGIGLSEKEYKEWEEQKIWFREKQEAEERKRRLVKLERERTEREESVKWYEAKKAEDKQKIKTLKAERDKFFHTSWTPVQLGYMRDINVKFLAVNLEKMIQMYPERAKAINWDEACLEVGGRNFTLRQILDRAISEWDSERGAFYPSAPWHKEYMFFTFGYNYYYEDQEDYKRMYGGKNDVDVYKKIKQILLQQGAKPKTTSLTLQRKKKLTIPEDAPYVDWAKWGATIQDPRVKGGATRKRNKKNRKNMSRKKQY